MLSFVLHTNIYLMLNEIKKGHKILSVLIICYYNFKFFHLHEPDFLFILDIHKNSIFIYLFHLQYATFFDEEEFFALCPGVFQCVSEYLTTFQVCLILVVLFWRNLLHKVGVFAIVEEKIIICIFVTYTLFEQLLYFL